MTALPAFSLGKYKLVAPLGKGGMAEVFLASVVGPAAFNKLLVIKVMRAEAYTSHSELIDMFLDEARISARLNHPNIVQTYEVGHVDGRYFIAMEYLEGQTLRALQRKLRGTTLPTEDALRIVIETARGLHYAHELRGYDRKCLEIVHRDVSPQNVFLTYEGGVKLLDFGIAKAQDCENLTKAGVIKGKPDYMAPEQLRGEKVDRRADVFSLGVMAWELLAGLRFAGGFDTSDLERLRSRLSGGERGLRAVKHDVPAQLDTLIGRAIALEPDQRFASAGDLADSLEAFLEEEGLRPRPRTLGECVAESFQAERLQLALLVENRLQLLQAANTSSRSFALRSARSRRRNERAELEQQRDEPREDTSSAAPESVSVAGDELGRGLLARGLRGLRMSQLQLAACAATLAVSMLLALLAPARPGRHSRSLPVVSTTSSPEHTANEATKVSPGQAVAPASEPSTIRLRVAISPKRAKAWLDGEALPTSPFVAELQKDGDVHYIEVSASGYERKRVPVPFDRDRELTIALQRPATVARRVAESRTHSARAAAANSSASFENSSATSASTAALHSLALEPQPGERMEFRGRGHDAIDPTNPYNE